jgi:hypothetical protein
VSRRLVLGFGPDGLLAVLRVGNGSEPLVDDGEYSFFADRGGEWVAGVGVIAAQRVAAVVRLVLRRGAMIARRQVAQRKVPARRYCPGALRGRHCHGPRVLVMRA